MKKPVRKFGKKKAPSSIFTSNIDWDKAAKLFGPVQITDVNHDYPLARDLLRIVAAAGVVGLSLAAPGAGKVLAELMLGDRAYSRWRTKQVVDRLHKGKFVKIRYNKDATVSVTLTKSGWVRALTYQLDTMQLKQPKRWDKRWRAVVFDVPEKYKKLRDTFRMRLKQLGLRQLQESVYVSPYPCFDEIEFLRELYGISFTIHYLLVEKIEDDESLMQLFNLAPQN